MSKSKPTGNKGPRIPIEEHPLFSITHEGPITIFHDLRPKDADSKIIGVPNVALRTGSRLNDGAVVLSYFPDQGEVLVLPEQIFAGEASRRGCQTLIKAFNSKNVHGLSNWRQITSDEGERLHRLWSEVASKEYPKPFDFWNSPATRVKRVEGCHNIVFSEYKFPVAVVCSLKV